MHPKKQGKNFHLNVEENPMLTSGIHSGNAIYNMDSVGYAKSKRTTRNASSSFDTVQISEEARSAYASYKKNNANAENKPTASVNFNFKDTAIEDKLTAFFNKNHSGSNVIISGDLTIDLDVGELIPENNILKEQIEAQINQIREEENYSPPDVASPEYLKKYMPLFQKLSTIQALGDSIVITDDILEESAYYLQKLEDNWNKERGYDNSIEGQFNSAIHGTGDIPANRMTDDEIERKMKEDLMKKMEDTQKQ